VIEVEIAVSCAAGAAVRCRAARALDSFVGELLRACEEHLRSVRGGAFEQAGTPVSRFTDVFKAFFAGAVSVNGSGGERLGRHGLRDRNRVRAGFFTIDTREELID